MRTTPRVAGFRSEYPAGFELECMAGFVGIRTTDRADRRTPNYAATCASLLMPVGGSATAGCS
ncbi:hypothetical protein, partial [Bradyrhizobium sp. I1.7.5]|uniref:hypothetical protein n=1 Tax=Bradyrhizobium sp. I1.7.5 TaxID=3156363 RepID=UPI0033957D4A